MKEHRRLLHPCIADVIRFRADKKIFDKKAKKRYKQTVRAILMT